MVTKLPKEKISEIAKQLATRKTLTDFCPSVQVTIALTAFMEREERVLHYLTGRVPDLSTGEEVYIANQLTILNSYGILEDGTPALVPYLEETRKVLESERDLDDATRSLLEKTLAELWPTSQERDCYTPVRRPFFQ